MSLRTALVSRVAEKLTGAARQQRLRLRTERRRYQAGLPHVVDYFHQADDPYAALMVQVLPAFAARYDVQLRCHLVATPPDWAAPERERLVNWSRADAAHLASRAGLSFTDAGAQPSAQRVANAERLFASRLRAGTFVADAAAISAALWSGAELPDASGDPATAKAEGDALRSKLGHYLGATLHYGSEWYWGLDRLHYLEERLSSLGVDQTGTDANPIYVQPPSPAPDASANFAPSGGAIDFFLSFRSPYTWIAATRVKALADAYGLGLRLRFVLPMVMRGLPVPPAKRAYITLDAAREARRNGVPFGRIADPVGRPVERGYSLLPWAISQGRGHEYCVAFMRAVWSEGVDAGSDAGMRRIVEAAGLDWTVARPLIGNDVWRTEAEANRRELVGLGLWGVPCFAYNGVSAWGQDRLWVIESAIRSTQSKISGR
jgi:2-hydroxychromene-2-carboxylate isomerase